MKKSVFIVCFILLVKPVIPVFQYLLDYDYISKELCVNKETPIMGCNGKCYLMKQLAKASETEKPISSDKKHVALENTDWFFKPTNPFQFIIFENADSPVNDRYLNFYKNTNPSLIFHPPATIS